MAPTVFETEMLHYVQEHLRILSGFYGILKLFEEVQGKLVQKGVYCKMARGEMVRFMAENRIEKPEGIKQFAVMGYHFSEELSSKKEYVFLRKND